MEHDKPVMVFNYLKEGNIQKAIAGEKIGTLIASKVQTVTA